ncbi:energy transducer TonB [Asaia sp. VD9]|uniref:energy transducer TonB n=1 Tax=Asaia sp. VD9 TaxID=3081235 RepID=UPI0038D2232D
MHRVLIPVLLLCFTSCSSTPKNQPRPYYPADLIKKGETGDITASCDVPTDGRPQNCRIISSTNHNLDAAAFRFLDKARYSPATQNGHPVIERGHIFHINFRLGD